MEDFRTTMRRLIKEVTDGVGDNFELRRCIAFTLGWTCKQVGGVIAWYAPEEPGNMRSGPPQWLTSLDEAFKLIPEGWHLGCLTECDEEDNPRATVTENEEKDGDVFDASAVSHQLPRALTAAALKARIKRLG